MLQNISERQYVSVPKVDDKQTTRLHVSRALDRNDLAHNDSRIQTGSDRKCPTSSGVAVLLESRCSK